MYGGAIPDRFSSKRLVTGGCLGLGVGVHRDVAQALGVASWSLRRWAADPGVRPVQVVADAGSSPPLWS